MDFTAVRMIELWVDTHDGKGFRQMLFEPNERQQAADYARNAILQGWAVQCI